MTHVFIKELARRNPGRLALYHYYPGFVPIDIANSSTFPRYLKFLLTYVVNPLFRPFWVPLEECGQRVLFMASPVRFIAVGSQGVATAVGKVKDVEVAVGVDSQIGSGAYLVTRDDDASCKWNCGEDLSAHHGRLYGD
ncbi:hypothetical protein F5B19DRAFT_275702 [Rostrohypoxylon terebratum]|nr:hypothetical protein F5B19DRAFT_275702 [Rostrohypoxylon terebratum]